MKIRNERPFFSIITIVYNGVNEIQRTIDSVVNQDFLNFEFIVIDGGSNDGTQEVIEKNLDHIDFYSSKKDLGIYDAMNKGIKQVKGKWVNFMNAGDTFFSKSVLTNVFNLIEDRKEILLYGNKYENEKKIVPSSLSSLSKGIIMGNHQSMFFNYEVIGDDLLYSLDYPIYGDYELVNKLYLNYGEKSFQYLDIPIANYEGGGISSKISTQKRKDKYRVLYKYYGVIGVLRGFVFSFLYKLKK
ncbi:glycosyltransferase family 2 protein [Tenacibaculum sp. 190524A05c]|uniref:glycosyltransferase family 2 protein n=1 Tax=Tenacibaculum platacis TaxID=3137852 RepID=UPI0031FB2222